MILLDNDNCDHHDEPTKPAKSDLKLAIRDELLLLLDGDLTESKARRLSKVATAGATLLKLVEKPVIPKPEDLKKKGGADFVGAVGYDMPEPDDDDEGATFNGVYSGSTSLAPSPPAETFGARMLNELVASIPMLLGSMNQTPHALVAALTLARQNGMSDVAEELEKKLTGKKLEGDKPVTQNATDTTLVAIDPRKGAALSAGVAMGALTALGGNGQ